MYFVMKVSVIILLSVPLQLPARKLQQMALWYLDEGKFQPLQTINTGFCAIISVLDNSNVSNIHVYWITI